MTPPIARSRHQKGPSQAPTASQTRRKWNKMRGEGYIDEEDDDDSTPFERLPVVNFNAITEFTDCIIRLRHPEPVPQLSRPPRVTIPPIPEKVPPVSMGFGAFEEKFKELEKAGLIDGAGEWPDENDDASPTPS
ncbi:hypothetical protein DAEQUDRAFT_810323 [Daedalea quercina L-15889]|uniref:Uncharacterized protein n=1 Tax=Daedalea quercina L-15889 TaxID=1314783 RepID=A0A165RGA5_9APHY|nr:hypothetical protein DAEQUDRAFT_810323 [Daedalea quercina L-15889]